MSVTWRSVNATLSATGVSYSRHFWGLGFLITPIGEREHARMPSESFEHGARLAHASTLFLTGLPAAMVTVIASVYLIREVGLDPLVVGLYANAATILGIMVTHAASKGGIDRAKSSVLIPAALVAGTGTVAFLAAAMISPLFLVGAVITQGFAQLLMPGLFVFDGRYNPTAGATAGMYATRLIVSVIWIAGPMLAFYLFWLGSFPLVAVVHIAISLVMSAVIVFIARARISNMEASPPASSSERKAGGLIILALLVCVTSANVLHAVSMPLYLLETLGAPEYLPGLVIGLSAATEVAVISLIPRLIERVGEEMVLFVGLGVGIAYFATLALVSDPIALLVLQVLYGTHFALSSVICLGILKKYSGLRIGSVAARFVNAGKLGNLLGNGLFALFAASLGYLALMTGFGLALTLIAAAVAIAPIPGGPSKEFRRRSS